MKFKALCYHTQWVWVHLQTNKLGILKRSLVTLSSKWRKQVLLRTEGCDSVGLRFLPGNVCIVLSLSPELTPPTPAHSVSAFNLSQRGRDVKFCPGNIPRKPLSSKMAPLGWPLTPVITLQTQYWKCQFCSLSLTECYPYFPVLKELTISFCSHRSPRR